MFIHCWYHKTQSLLYMYLQKIFSELNKCLSWIEPAQNSLMKWIVATASDGANTVSRIAFKIVQHTPQFICTRKWPNTALKGLLNNVKGNWIISDSLTRHHIVIWQINSNRDTYKASYTHPHRKQPLLETQQESQLTHSTHGICVPSRCATSVRLINRTTGWSTESPVD